MVDFSNSLGFFLMEPSMQKSLRWRNTSPGGSRVRCHSNPCVLKISTIRRGGVDLEEAEAVKAEEDRAVTALLPSMSFT